MKMKGEHIGVGRRKCAVAAVRLRKGKNKIEVNGGEFKDYFKNDLQRRTILSPFEKLGNIMSDYEIIIRTKGGGIEGQTIAVRLGLARALVQEDEERRGVLKSQGYLTRDPRKRERKKYGLAGARKSFQFSKR